MRIHYAAPFLSATLYAALGELYYQGDRRVRDTWGHCVDVPVTYAPVALAIGAVVFLASTAIIARSAATRWKRSTALSAALALLVGGAAGLQWYGMRMARGSECAQIRYCVWCDPPWWQHDTVSLVLLAALGAALALPVGWIARRIARKPSWERHP